MRSEAFLGVADEAVAVVTMEALTSFGASGNDWNGLTVEPITPLTWITNNEEVTITDCNGAAAGELVIPDTIEGNPVTSIGDNAFQNCTSLTSITIPDGVTSIGDYAFRECTSLTSITIPDSVTSIGEFAFYNCRNLAGITIGNSVTSIGGGAFRSCISLTSITIPDGVTSIGTTAFMDCSSLTSVTIPDSVTSIEGFAFFDCTSLTSITIPDRVTNIGYQAFRNCTSLTSITFQGDAPTVGIDAFLGMPDAAVAVVTLENQASFGDLGVEWNGLTVSMSAAYLNELLTRLNSPSAAVATARTAGQGDVTSDPASYGLVTQTIYNAVVTERDAFGAERVAVVAERDAAIAERDARPTAEQLASVEAERDARPTADQLTTVESERNAVVADIQLAYDEATAAAGTTAGDLAPVGSDGTTFDLIWTSVEDPSDTIAMTMKFPEGSPTNRPDIALKTTVQESALTINYQGSVTTHLEPNMIFQVGEELDFSQELIGQAGFGLELGGDFNIFGITVDEGAFEGVEEFTVGAPNGVKYTLTSMKMKITSKFGFLELSPLSEIYFDLAEANEAVLTERDARPTAEQLATVEAERDARFTEDQIRNMSVDHTVGLNEAGNMQVKIGFIQSADLNTYTPFTVIPDSLSVVDGKICMEFPPSDAENFFFRFRIE